MTCTHLPFPPRWGYATRVYQLARQVSRRHDLTLLTYAEPGQAADVERLREQMDVRVVVRPRWSAARKRLRQATSLVSRDPFLARQVYSRPLQRALDALLAADTFDLVQLETGLLTVLRLDPRVPVILDEHNVDFEVSRRLREAEPDHLRRAFYRWEEARLQSFNTNSWRRATGCAIPSQREADIVQRYCPDTPVAVVPNAVDVEFFRPAGTRVRPHSLVFNGVLDYRPNLAAAALLVHEVLPLVRRSYPDVHLSIVGRHGAADVRNLQVPGVDLTGEVADIRPYLDNAHVVVVPVTTGGGTRLKVLEGLAMRTPMVSTTLGCEGVAVEPGEHLLVADTTADLAAAVGRLFEDPALASRIAAGGRQLIEDRYSWDRAGDMLQELYDRVTRAVPAAGISRHR